MVVVFFVLFVNILNICEECPVELCNSKKLIPVFVSVSLYVYLLAGFLPSLYSVPWREERQLMSSAVGPGEVAVEGNHPVVGTFGCGI